LTTITSPDDHGFFYVSVCADFIFSTKPHSWRACSDIHFTQYASYRQDELHTDPGYVRQLNSWVGITHVNSLVNLQTSNVENTIKRRWSRPSVPLAIQFLLNDALNSEFGIRPFDAMFGTESGAYFYLPTNPPAAAAHEQLLLFNDNLFVVKDLPNKYHKKVAASRRTHASVVPNTFQLGDFVILHLDKPWTS
jgi:hypothetical protein